MKIAVFMPNWVGDAIMATPAVRALRTKFSDVEIVAIARPVIVDTLQGLNSIDRVIVHDHKNPYSEHRGWKFIKALRSERFDTAILFPNSMRSAWNAWCSGAKRRIGFSRDARGIFLTDRLKPFSRRTPNPVLKEYLRLVERLGCDVSSMQTELVVTRHDEEARHQFFSQQPDQVRAAPYIVLNPGGAFGAAKHWPTESFAELAKRISSELNHNVIVLCGPAEKDIASEIVRLADDTRVTSLAEQQLSIGLSKSIVQTADLMVTTDSGPRHFAQPFGVPVITLFGPTHIAWSETFYSRGVHLQEQMDCGPCQKRVCPLGHHNCMKQLSVDRVFRSVARALERRTSSIEISPAA